MREPRKLHGVGDRGGCRRPPPALRWVAAVVGLVMAAFTTATLWAILTAIHWGAKQALTELAYLVIVCTVGCGGMLFAWSIYRGGFDGPTDLLGPTLMRTVPGLVLSGVTAGALALSMGRYAYISDASWPYVLSAILWVVAAQRWLRRAHRLWLAQRIAASAGPAIETIP